VRLILNFSSAWKDLEPKPKNISKLIIDNDNTINDPKKILDDENKYYQMIYHDKINYQDAEAIEAEKYVLDEQEKQLLDTDKNVLDSNIIYEEITMALKELPPRQSPGGHGLPMEFYKFFWIDMQEY
jgi:hypothetical protein